MTNNTETTTIEELATEIGVQVADLIALIDNDQSDSFEHLSENGTLDTGEVTTLTDAVEELGTATPYRATLILEARDESGGYTSQMQAHIATEMGEIGYGVEWMPASEAGQYRTLHPSEPIVTAGDLNDRDWEILNSAISEAWGL